MTAATAAHAPPDHQRILEAAAALRLVGTGPDSPANLIPVLCDDEVGADELAERIEAQPLLSARVLQVANSPFYGQAKTVANIQRALMLLGIDVVRRIATAACVDQVMPHRIACLPDMPAILRHSLATAIAGEMLATMTHPLLAHDAFLAGLLHNLGIVLQASIDPEGTAALIAARKMHPTEPIRRLEQQHSLLSHEECVQVLFDAWQLPDSLVESSSHHHALGESQSAHRVLSNLVCASASLALSCGNTFSLEPVAPAMDIAGWGELGLYERHIEDVRAELPQRVTLLRGAFA
ncbi:MAG: HDOD domain-containing protein [Proteobacteria bacterium]|nr:HDOD domain-containing protein [Pseudomonadota bacterium]